MFETIIELVIKWVVPFVLTSSASWILGRAKAKKEKDDKQIKAMSDGIQCLLRAEIIRANEKYTKQGFCPVYAKESLKVAYNSYHALGGNDVATGLFNECVNLPSNQN